jgi:CheY-like chemotaxis protein
MPVDVKRAVAALVVDDSMLIRHTVCRFLEDRGFSVESASNGLEALEHVKRRTPDIIITDINMPKMNGTDMITVLKNDPSTAGIPVITLAGKSSGASQSGEQRANLAVFKDIDIEDQLARALESLLGNRAMGKSSGV